MKIYSKMQKEIWKDKIKIFILFNIEFNKRIVIATTDISTLLNFIEGEIKGRRMFYKEKKENCNGFNQQEVRTQIRHLTNDIRKVIKTDIYRTVEIINANLTNGEIEIFQDGIEY